jgi:hypothetical protein
LGNVVNDVRASPDKLSGFGSILSAVPARVSEVEPHEYGFVGFLSIDKAIEDTGAPIEALENGVVALERGVGFDALKCLPVEGSRGLSGGLGADD